MICFEDQEDFEKQIQLNNLFFEKTFGKMKKVVKKFKKSLNLESNDSLTRLKINEKNENEEKRLHHYEYLLAILKIHIFFNVQTHQYLSKFKTPIKIEKINLKLLLLNVFELANEFYKDMIKQKAISSKNLDIKCEIREKIDFIQNDSQILENVFLVIFFSLISKNYLENVQISFEYEKSRNDKKYVKFFMVFSKDNLLIKHKQNPVNEVALYLTETIFETTNLSENDFAENLFENLKKYTIYEISLNLLLYNIKKMGCIDFQIQDLSDKNQIRTGISFKIPNIIATDSQNFLRENKFDDYNISFKLRTFKFRNKKNSEGKMNNSVLEEVSVLKSTVTESLKLPEQMKQSETGQRKKIYSSESINDLKKFKEEENEILEPEINEKKFFKKEVKKLEICNLDINIEYQPSIKTKSQGIGEKISTMQTQIDMIKDQVIFI